jgi:hypothetical protein
VIRPSRSGLSLPTWPGSVYAGEVPDDVGGQPFTDGEEPDDRPRGGADDAFASVVFDESFVRAAGFHEPSAAERLLAADRARAEDMARFLDDGHGPDDTGPLRGDGTTHGYGFGPAAPLHPDPPWYEEDDSSHERPYRGHVRWQRPVAWVLAVVMGLGMVALAFSAIHRSVSGERGEPSPPPVTNGLEEAGGAAARSA